MRPVAEHLGRIQVATERYIAANNERDACIIEARIDGASIEQIAESARLPLAAVARILGEEL